MSFALRHLIRVCSLVAALCGPICAAAVPPAEIFFKNPDLGEAVLSPSGRKLAFTSNKGEARVGLVIFDVLAPGSPAKRIAHFADGDVHSVHWVNDDLLIFSVARADDIEGPGRYGSATALYAVNSDGSSPQRVLSGPHRVLRVPIPGPGQANPQILMAFNDRDGTESVPKWLDVRKGWTRVPERLNAPPNTVGWFSDRHGELRVAVTLSKGRQGAYWRAPGSTEWKQLYESELLAVPFQIEGVGDAGGLYVSRSSGPEGYQWLSRYDFKAGKPEDAFIVRTPGFDFDGMLLNLDGKLQGVRFVVDGETTHWFAPQMKAMQERVDGIFPDHINRIDCRRCGEADMVAVVFSYSDHDPGNLYLYQAKPPEGEKTWRRIGEAMDGIKAEQMASMSLHRIKARDGRDLPVWVTRPDDAATVPRPAVVLVHGGPWMRGRAWGWHAMPQFLASRGYVVIEPEMRGSTGYGEAHFRASFKQWGQAMQDDVADALRWAQAQGIASDKACIAGDSYGGYSALMGLANDPGLFRCGSVGFAPTDLGLFLQGSAWVADDIGATARKYTLPEMVGTVEKDAAMVAAQSPVNQAAKIKTPVMLVYGERDWRVPLTQGERMRKALRNAGNDPVWVTYTEEGHGLYYLNNRVDRAQKMAAFLATHLGKISP